jgi:hypothetical protein
VARRSVVQHTCVTEHADLAENEVPASDSIELIELLVQDLTDTLDAACLCSCLCI